MPSKYTAIHLLTCDILLQSEYIFVKTFSINIYDISDERAEENYFKYNNTY